MQVWEVTLPGETVERVGGAKCIITDSGALLIVERDGMPAAAWSANAWHSVRPAGRLS